MHRVLTTIMVLYGVLGAAAWGMAYAGLTDDPRSPLHSLIGIYIALPWTAMVGGISAPENDWSNLSSIAGGILINLAILERLRRRTVQPSWWR